MRVFLAGATGAVGRTLLAQLLEAGQDVTGTTRSPARASFIQAMGAQPIVVDVFDAEAFSQAISGARPDIVIDQLTDLPPGLDASRMEEGARRNARIRSEGTRNLIAAMSRAGVRRIIAQSIAWIYADGSEPHSEGDRVEVNAEGSRGVTLKGVAVLEHLVLRSADIDGVVLRYGHLYGPGTGTPAGAPPSVHVDAAAAAAALAIECAGAGIYNIAEPCQYLSIDKARRELRWDPSFRARGSQVGGPRLR